ASDILLGVQRIIKTLQMAGAKVALNTIIPLGGALGNPPEPRRLKYNAMVRAGLSGADLVIDLSTTLDGATAFLADPSGGPDTITTNTTYYNADGIHLTDLGYLRVGEKVFAALAAAGFLDPKPQTFYHTPRS